MDRTAYLNSKFLLRSSSSMVRYVQCNFKKSGRQNPGVQRHFEWSCVQCSSNVT